MPCGIVPASVPWEERMEPGTTLNYPNDAAHFTAMLPGWQPTTHAELRRDEKNKSWVMHVKSRQEKALSEDLEIMGIRHFLPVMREPRLHGSRRVIVTVPVFPGYLFLWGSIEDAFRADRTKRVVRILPVVDQTRLNNELFHLHRALASGLPIKRHIGLERGMPVEVESGPLRGLRGIVESPLSPTRVILQVKMLGSAVSVDISTESVVAVD
jgi:transcription antitermination factor NusG